jgi:hypothetical protein
MGTFKAFQYFHRRYGLARFLFFAVFFIVLFFIVSPFLKSVIASVSEAILPLKLLEPKKRDCRAADLL